MYQARAGRTGKLRLPAVRSGCVLAVFVVLMNANLVVMPQSLIQRERHIIEQFIYRKSPRDQPLIHGILNDRFQ